jgi:hypothetical protein
MNGSRIRVLGGMLRVRLPCPAAFDWARSAVGTR